MTGAVREAIESGQFADAEWMREYTVTFAEYYRRAFLAFERGRPFNAFATAAGFVVSFALASGT